MFDVDYLLPVEKAELDNRGSLSLYHLMGNVFAEKFPVELKQFIVMLSLLPKHRKPVVNRRLTIRLTVTLGDYLVAEAKAVGTFTIEKYASLTTPIKFEKIVFNEPGDYTLQLYVNNELLKEKLLRLIPLSDLSET